MIRKQKVYDVGTLVSQRVNEFDAWLKQNEIPWENGIIIERYRNQSDLPKALYYRIQWDNGGSLSVPAKVLKGMVKAGSIKILSEG